MRRVEKAEVQLGLKYSKNKEKGDEDDRVVQKRFNLFQFCGHRQHQHEAENSCQWFMSMWWPELKVVSSLLRCVVPVKHSIICHCAMSKPPTVESICYHK